MYPKLKVRSQEQDVRYKVGINPSLPGLKALDSLVHGDFSSSVKKKSEKPTSKKLEAQEPSPSNLGSITPLSASQDKNDRDEDIRTHIRASPIPRPRAVLSSPVNDSMIGTKTKRTGERASSLKPHQSDQKCSVSTKPLAATGRPKDPNESSKEATNKSEIHKTRQMGTKCNVTVKHPATGRHRSGRVEPEDTLNKSIHTACKGSAPTAIRIKIEK